MEINNVDNLTVHAGTVVVHGIANQLTTYGGTVQVHGIVNNHTECRNNPTKVEYRDRVIEKVRVVEKVVHRDARKHIDKETAELRQLLNKRNEQISEMRMVIDNMKEVIRAKVEDETRELRERIAGLTEANHEAARRIAELEAAHPAQSSPAYDYDPSRMDMLEMIKERDWWLGDGVRMDESETLRMPWIDYRDEFRKVRVDDFLEWCRERVRERHRVDSRRRYAEKKKKK